MEAGKWTNDSEHLAQSLHEAGICQVGWLFEELKCFTGYFGFL